MADDFDAKVVNPAKMKPLAAQLEAKTRSICEKLTENHPTRRHLDEN